MKSASGAIPWPEPVGRECGAADDQRPVRLALKTTADLTTMDGGNIAAALR
jgi:hypothetical protein